MQELIAARSARIAAEATGRVLDLGVGHGLSFGSAAVLVDPDDAGEVDHVVSVGALTVVPDLPSTLARLRGRVGENGRLILFEPVAEPATEGSLARLRRLRPLRRRHPGLSASPKPRDVLWALWESGFAVTTADHLTLAGDVGPPRRWVFAIARVRRMPRPDQPLIADAAATGTGT